MRNIIIYLYNTEGNEIAKLKMPEKDFDKGPFNFFDKTTGKLMGIKVSLEEIDNT